MGIGFRWIVAFALGFVAPLAAASAVAPPAPLFASDDVLRLTIRGPISTLVRTAPTRIPRDATLSVTGTAETHAVRLAPRGLTRLKPETCQFPPLRIDFVQPPSASQLFAGQSRLKLVTHCRASEAFQQHLLLEYAAYRLYSVLTAASHRARLAHIDYTGEDGRLVTSRLGFFIEEVDATGRRNGMREIRIPNSIPTARLSATDAARAGLFEYMIGNLDWSLRSGPPGSDCCHNANLIGPNPAGFIVAVPYDFDFSGLVNAPYAVPPDSVPVRSVRQRRYRGYCRHNAQALAMAAEFRSKRAALLDELARIPRLEERTRRSATAYLDGFFNDIRSDSDVTSKLLRNCIN